MKIAFYIEDGLEQIVLTPEGPTEKAILDKLHDGSRELAIHKGSFFDCRGGWVRHTPHQSNYGYGLSVETGDESTMIVLRPALAAATDTAKTAKLAECEASQSGPKGNAQPPEAPHD